MHKRQCHSSKMHSLSLSLSDMQLFQFKLVFLLISDVFDGNESKGVTDRQACIGGSLCMRAVSPFACPNGSISLFACNQRKFPLVPCPLSCSLAHPPSCRRTPRAHLPLIFPLVLSLASSSLMIESSVATHGSLHQDTLRL